MPRGTNRRPCLTSTSTASTWCNRPEKRHKKPVDLHADLHGSAESGARTWTRTKDPQINRRVPLPRETMTWLASIYTKRDFRPKPIKGLHFHLHGNGPAYRHSLSALRWKV